MKNDHISCFPENLDSGLRRNDEFNQSSSLPLVERKQEEAFQQEFKKSLDRCTAEIQQVISSHGRAVSDLSERSPENVLNALVELVAHRVVNRLNQCSCSCSQYSLDGQSFSPDQASRPSIHEHKENQEQPQPEATDQE